MTDAEIEIVEHFKQSFLEVESEVHFDKDLDQVEPFFGGFVSTSTYEDGLATRNFRDYLENYNFNFSYNRAITDLNDGNDPHIRWRARIFEFFLKSSLPGKCLELGTARGFMFYFGLTKLQLDKIDLVGSEIYLVDKYDQYSVDFESGEISQSLNERYVENEIVVRSLFAPWPQVKVIKGLVPYVLQEFDLTGFRFVHVDLNAMMPEIEALRLLIPKLSKGATILLDDFGFPEFIPSRLGHTQLADELRYDILSLPTGQGLIII